MGAGDANGSFRLSIAGVKDLAIIAGLFVSVGMGWSELGHLKAGFAELRADVKTLSERVAKLNGR